MSESGGRRTFAPAIFYQDPKAALAWLEEAFGFETRMVVSDDDGNIGHAEMRFGDSYLMIGGEWAPRVKSPASIGGDNTQSTHVQLDEDIDAHCSRARAAGAVIEQEPEDQFYGDRVYRAKDPEGHQWSFGQTLRSVSREEAERASGFKIDGWI